MDSLSHNIKQASAVDMCTVGEHNVKQAKGIYPVVRPSYSSRPAHILRYVTYY